MHSNIRISLEFYRRHKIQRMHRRLIGIVYDRWKGIEDVAVNMVIFYVIFYEGKNIAQVEIYDKETVDEYL